MTEGVAVIRNKLGMHARPASVFVQKASSFKSKIQIRAKGRVCDAKSILMVMSMGLVNNTEVTIIADGSDEREAVVELKALIDSAFGEEVGFGDEATERRKVRKGNIDARLRAQL